MNKTTIIAMLFGAFITGTLVWFTNRPPVRFEDVALNKDLPDEYKTRVLWKQADTFKYHLAQLAGHVIIGDKQTGVFRRGPRYLQSGFEPSEEIIKDGTIYSSKVDRRAGMKGDFLGVSAEMDGTQTAEVVIADASTVFIPWEKIPLDELKGEAGKPVEAGEDKYYVQAVVLATVTIRNYAQLSGTASAVKGNAFSANGKIYSETGDVSKEHQISMLLLPLRDLNLANFSETPMKKLAAPTFTIKALK